MPPWWALYGALQLPGLPVSVGTGGRTKFNRHRFFIPKTHALDAVSVGNMDTVVEIAGAKHSTFDITAYGRGRYQRTRLTRSSSREATPCGPNRSMDSRSEIKPKPWFPKATSKRHIPDQWR
jgi:hypothetical protein